MVAIIGCMAVTVSGGVGCRDSSTGASQEVSRSTGVAQAPVVARLPARPAAALGGQDFLAATTGFTLAARDAAVVSEVRSGNVPDFVRSRVTLQIQRRDATGVIHGVEIGVCPDYLAVGSNMDFVRMPLGAGAAQQVADLVDASLPTRQLVDDVWGQATVRLTPQPLPPTAAMTSNAWIAQHHRLIQAQLQGQPRDQLTVGHKKDLVLSRLLELRPGRVAIYGWHWPSGSVIQPLSTVHHAGYSDYSHGLRLVDRRVRVDGQARELGQLLRDPVLSRLVSDEGPLAQARLP